MARDVLVRVAAGAYANLALGPALERSALDGRDRAFATDLVYGTVRMQRSCDWLVGRFLTHDPDRTTRQVLRLGAYQLAFLDTPPHAAVGATVEVAPRRTRGLVNAVLRKVASSPVTWPGDAVRLSYPDWVVDILARDLGEGDALDALATMNRPPVVHRRADGYVQDPASQWVAQQVGAVAGERIADVCAGPGGKATSLAATGAAVVAADLRPHRAALVRSNATEVGVRLDVVVADGRRSPLRRGAFDAVLVDAPCSGLGVLRRRPDARWRIEAQAVDRLATLQRAVLDTSVGLLRPGGRLVYSVCTLTAAETVGIDEWMAEAHPALGTSSPPGPPWTGSGRGARLLPQDADTDGMYVLTLRRPK